MYFWRLLLLLTAALLSVSSVVAQRDRDSYTSGPAIEISGQIQIPQGGPPASSITVRLERFSGGILDQMPPDARGKFRFTNLARGYYTVYINAPGYKQVQQQVDMQVVQRTYLVFELVPEKSATGAPPQPRAVIDARVPLEAQGEFSKGQAALQEKKFKEAAQHLTKAIHIYPDFFEAEFLLGSAYMEDQRLSDAEAALRRALELKPESAATLVSLGEVERREKHFAEAEKTLQAALKLDEKMWQGHFALARVYWEQGEIMKAAQPTGRTLQLKPDFAEAHLLAGNILLKVGQPERALTEFEEYLRLAPKGEFAGQAQDIVQKIKEKGLPKKQ